MPDESPIRIAILGAGPMGLEAALYARYLGFAVELFEPGECVAAWLWHGRERQLADPFFQCATPLGVAAIEAQDPDWQCPDASERLSVAEYVRCYLQPLAETDLVAASVRLNITVVALGRAGWSEREGEGGSRGGKGPFRLLTRSQEQEPTAERAPTGEDVTGEDVTGEDVTGEAPTGDDGPVSEADVAIDCLGIREIRKESEQEIPAPAGTSHGTESLHVSEPDYYLLDLSDHGGSSPLSLSAGFGRIRDLFAILGERDDLDLYATMKPIGDAKRST